MTSWKDWLRCPACNGVFHKHEAEGEEKMYCPICEEEATGDVGYFKLAYEVVTADQVSSMIENSAAEMKKAYCKEPTCGECSPCVDLIFQHIGYAFHRYAKTGRE